MTRGLLNVQKAQLMFAVNAQVAASLRCTSAVRSHSLNFSRFRTYSKQIVS